MCADEKFSLLVDSNVKQGSFSGFGKMCIWQISSKTKVAFFLKSKTKGYNFCSFRNSFDNIYKEVATLVIM